jgi:hypothetical protein
MPDYLHNHKDFSALLRIVGQELNIEPALVEKDYWIMHTLYGLTQQGYEFELKGGTSLSKGYSIIHRFSEDIDIHIKPPAELDIDESPKKEKAANIEAKRKFYDSLAADIQIDGITEVIRDTDFDDTRYYRSGGIRLNYKTATENLEGIKDGILLEAGFDTVTPNDKLTISSWAYDKAVENKADIIDNRAVDIACYHPGYTLVEKLQTITTKFRQEQDSAEEKPNLMRQYYDVAALLHHPKVQEFVGSEEYEGHKQARFSAKDKEIQIAENEAFLLQDAKLRTGFEERYKKTAALYYKGQPPFGELLDTIQNWIKKL